MKVRKALITAAAPNQRTLPLQTLVDRDGAQKPILEIILDEALSAGIEEVCVVVAAGDQDLYPKAAGPHAHRVRFVEQASPRGYGHAVFCAREFTGQDPFLHLVGDHVYVAPDSDGSAPGPARRLIEIAEAEDCAVSAVQPTRENLLPRFGAVAGPRVPNKPNLYRIEAVIEKPTPTEAEQSLVVPGLRAGYYLCFFGMHVLTPAVMEILARDPSVTLSCALAELARKEQYLAFEQAGRRYDLGARYGLLNAQLALALSGRDREEVLSQLIELLSLRALRG